MANLQIPEALMAEANDAISKVVDLAYRQGYERGQLDAVNRVMAAAQGLVMGPVDTAARGGLAVSPSPVARAARGEARVHPNSAETRRFPYGAVADAFRAALKRSGVFGAGKDELIALAGEFLGEDVSDMNHRDTLKRLKKSKELDIRDGRYFAGPALLGQNENGAAEAAPDADEVAPSSTENQGRLDGLG